MPLGVQVPIEHGGIPSRAISFHVINYDGSRVELFYVGTDDALYHRWQTTTGWSSQVAVAQGVKSINSIVPMSDDLLYVFYLDKSGNLYAMGRSNVSNWNVPTMLDSNVVAAEGVYDANTPHHVEAAYTKTDNTMYHVSQDASWNWQAPTKLNSFAVGIKFFLDEDGHPELVYVGTDGNCLYYRKST